MKKTIAQNMYEILIEENRSTVWYGDISIIEKCAKKSNITKTHPIRLINCILNALDKSALFTKGYIFADCNGRKRKYRCYTVKVGERSN